MTKEIVRHSAHNEDPRQIPTNNNKMAPKRPIGAQVDNLSRRIDARWEAERLERLADRHTPGNEPRQSKHKRS